VRINELSALAEVSPRGAILEGWIRLEETVRSLTGGKATPFVGAVLTDSYVAELVGAGRLPAIAQPIIGNLRQLRNQAAHIREADLTPASARLFLNLAGDVLRLMRSGEGE